MLVKTHWPALVPAIKRAGHEPVLVYPLEEDVPPPTPVDDRLVIIPPYDGVVVPEPVDE
jgi:hypothetical protein